MLENCKQFGVVAISAGDLELEVPWMRQTEERAATGNIQTEKPEQRESEE